MRDVGFLYVLANSAMPGLVKVGKTNRSPAERAAELSAATGLPTPFIVVFEQLFEDCDDAERFVHALLSEKGFRVADNREFFNATANEVIRAIQLAPGAINDADNAGREVHDDSGLLPSPSSVVDAVGDLSLQPAAQATPWRLVFDEAERSYYGLDDSLQDYRQAMRLFGQAAKLGAVHAYAYLGRMYEKGEGVREEHARAMDFYKDGARKGAMYCYWRMGTLFFYTGLPGEANALKCFRAFLRDYRERNTTSSGYLTNEEIDAVALDCVSLFLWSKLRGLYSLPDEVLDFSMGLARRIIGHATDLAGLTQDPSRGREYRQVAEFYRNHR